MKNRHNKKMTYDELLAACMSEEIDTQTKINWLDTLRSIHAHACHLRNVKEIADLKESCSNAIQEMIDATNELANKVKEV